MAASNKDDFLSKGIRINRVRFGTPRLNLDKNYPEDEPSSDYSANIEELNNKISEANKHFEELTKELDSFKSSMAKKLDDEIGTVKEQVSESKSRVVESLGLFAALFTFLSLQVQVFKDQASTDNVIGLVLITGGLITFFVLILDIMVKTKEDSKYFLKVRFFLLLTMSVLLVASGVMLLKIR
jgi:hypothetical protein